MRQKKPLRRHFEEKASRKIGNKKDRPELLARARTACQGTRRTGIDCMEQGEGAAHAALPADPQSDTDTPRKGPMVFVTKGEDWLSPPISAAAPSPTDAVAAVSQQTGASARKGGSDGSGEMAACIAPRSPVKSSMVSQTQNYESPGRRRVALSQNNNVCESHSQHTLQYQGARLPAETQQQTMIYQGHSIEKSSSQEASIRSHAEAPRNSDLPAAGGEGLALREEERYHALPSMASQLSLTPASQAIASQSQQRYTKLTTQAPEILHSEADFRVTQAVQLPALPQPAGSAALLPNSDGTCLRVPDLGSSPADAPDAEGCPPVDGDVHVAGQCCNESGADGLQRSEDTLSLLQLKPASTEQPKSSNASLPGAVTQMRPTLPDTEHQGPLAGQSAGGGKVAQLRREKERMQTTHASTSLDVLMSQGSCFIVAFMF